MAIRLKPVDVVLIGVGWTGSILAKELAEAGHTVVGLERGMLRQTVPDFQSPAMHDELRYAVRYGLMQDTSRETVTFRNSFYDRFEYLCGISGKAGNLRGRIQEGGNPFEGPRSHEYPNPPMKTAYAGALFRKAATDLGYHPFPAPSTNITRHYKNPYGVDLKPCMYCGFCERFGCEHFAKASPQTTVLPVALANKNFELRTLAHVTRVNVDRNAKRAVSVTYIDGQGREIEQPAGSHRAMRLRLPQCAPAAPFRYRQTL